MENSLHAAGIPSVEIPGRKWKKSMLNVHVAEEISLRGRAKQGRRFTVAAVIRNAINFSGINPWIENVQNADPC